MIIKQCEFCGKKIKAKSKSKRFCDDFCQRKHYYRRPEINKKMKAYNKLYFQRPEVKEKRSIWDKEYRKRHPEWKERHRILAITKYKERRKKYWKEYGKRPGVRARIRAKDKLRRQNDKEYAIADRLRRSLNHAMTKYSKTGKITKSNKYGIDWKEIIESLKPFPKKIEGYEIDHIIPLKSFNLTNINEVKKAFSPFNLQWLTIQENRRKSAKIVPKNEKIYKLLGID